MTKYLLGIARLFTSSVFHLVICYLFIFSFLYPSEKKYGQTHRFHQRQKSIYVVINSKREKKNSECKERNKVSQIRSQHKIEK